MGRKPIIAAAGILTIGGFICYNLSAFLGASPYVVGFFYGLYLPCWWTTIDFTSMVVAESTPTYNRASALAALGLLKTVGYVLGLLLPIVAALMFDHIGFGYMVTVVPFVVIGVVLLLWKTKDTNGVNLDEVVYEDEAKA